MPRRWLSELRAADRFGQTRALFLLFNLVSAALLAAVLGVAAWGGRRAALPAGLLLVLLGWKWIEEFRGRRFALGWDAVEAGALVAAGVAAANPLVILLLLYSRVAVRSLTEQGSRLVAIVAAYVAAFAVAVAFTSAAWSPGTQAWTLVFLASGFAITSPVMRTLADVLARLDAATERDLSEQRRIDAVLRESEENFRHLFERNPQPMWLYDAETFAILAVNDAAITAYGYSRDEFLAMPADSLDVEEATGSRHQLKNGSIIDVETQTSTVSFQGRSAVLLLARDVTEQRVLQRRLEHNALHDPLTGLPNQLLLRNRIRRALARTARRTRRSSAMLVFDLDGFKTVNDTLGHALGDRVIGIVGARLVRYIKSTDTAARLGGDEFAVLLEETADVADAAAVAHRLMDEIQRPITVEGQTVMISASCGVAVSRPDSRTAEDLLGDADIAMAVAKQRGTRACVTYDPSFRIALMDRLTLQKELSDALSGNQLSVVYQPQLDLVSGRVVAVEALVRWTHPARGAIPPDVFIPVAEQTGIVSTIDAWVLRTSCRALREWLDLGFESMRIAVNLSGRDLERADLGETIRDALAESNLEPWRLELELTETVAVGQPETAIARLQEMRAMGVRIAIDDFGTGFSMFSRLRELPIDRLKIDRSFVTDLVRDDDARTIVGSTIAMGHALGLDLVAEGIETAEGADVLRQLGCDRAQGYFFARPLPSSALTAWLRSHAATNAGGAYVSLSA